MISPGHAWMAQTQRRVAAEVNSAAQATLDKALPSTLRGLS
jgi:hypothetical protein